VRRARRRRGRAPAGAAQLPTPTGRKVDPGSTFRPVGGGCESPALPRAPRSAPPAAADRHAPRPPFRRQRWAASPPAGPRSRAGRPRPLGTRRTGPPRGRLPRRRRRSRLLAAASARRWPGSRHGRRGREPAAACVPAPRAAGRDARRPAAGAAKCATPAVADGARCARGGASCAAVERWRGGPPPASRSGPAAPRPGPRWPAYRQPASNPPHVRARPLHGAEPLLSSPVAQASFLQFVSPGPRGPFSCADPGGSCRSASISSLTLVPASRQLP
jgi:hypothetical protein